MDVNGNEHARSSDGRFLKLYMSKYEWIGLQAHKILRQSSTVERWWLTRQWIKNNIE